MNNDNNNNFSFQSGYPDQQVKTTGSKPKTIHVAHRRSPSELTTLMRMYTLHRQFFFVSS